MHLQQRLRSLSTELVTLRNRLHVHGSPANSPKGGAAEPAAIQAAPAPVAAQPAIPPRNATLAAPLAVPAPELRIQFPIAGAELEDLIHLQGPLTEDAVMKCLQARFAASNFYVSTRVVLNLPEVRGDIPAYSIALRF